MKCFKKLKIHAKLYDEQAIKILKTELVFYQINGQRHRNQTHQSTQFCPKFPGRQAST